MHFFFSFICSEQVLSHNIYFFRKRGVFILFSKTCLVFLFISAYTCIILFFLIAPLLVMGIGNVFKIDDRYINIDRLSIIGDNGDHSPNFFRQTSLLFHEWLAERFNLEDA